MNKHDIAAANRTLLERWRSLIHDAVLHQLRETARLLDEANGEPVTPPVLQIPMPSGDMLGLLMNGIDAALDEKLDPFGIELDGRGIKPKKSRQEIIAIVAEVLICIQKYESKGNIRNPKTRALEEVAGRHHLSSETINKAIKDKSVLGWATYKLFRKK